MAEKEMLFVHSLGTWLQVNCDVIKRNNDTINMKCFSNGKIVNGLLAVSLQLAKDSAIPNVMGENLEEEVQVRQWMEYALLINKLSDNITATKHMLEFLNDALSTRTYLVGNKRTLSDVALYKALYPVMVNLTYMEKEKLMHLGRWFDFIQNDQMVRQDNSIVLLGRPLL
ncbi:hypothetical protein J437_LFUL010289 [Ladona fulva]|uniref:Nuclear-export cofactor Arc1-like N-terminal domain-containing protein n=1 Tax=Ladona fulva TaxID=123851 RepID=A0A8K0KCI9_LADFU|nr:hypothetical protein J437_LFUL010289 [Ladona fulva]